MDGRVVVDPGTTPPASGTSRVLVEDAAHLAVVDGGELRVATANGPWSCSSWTS